MTEQDYIPDWYIPAGLTPKTKTSINSKKERYEKMVSIKLLRT